MIHISMTCQLHGDLSSRQVSRALSSRSCVSFLFYGYRSSAAVATDMIMGLDLRRLVGIIDDD